LNRPLAVVVVAYNSPDALHAALQPVQQVFRTIVVDNSSSPQVAAACGSGVEYLDPGRNLGFGAAVNLALGALDVFATAGYDVLLLNPDAQINPDIIRELQNALFLQDNVGAVAPRQVSPGSRTEQRVAWPFPSPARAWFEAVGLGGQLLHRHDFLTGSVLLLSGQAVREVGGFDETFFLYAEETDWQRRAADAGWRRVLQDDLLATHVGGGTSSDESHRERLFHAGQETYIRKWFGSSGWASYRTAVIIGCLIRYLANPGSERPAIARRLRLYLIGPKRALASNPGAKEGGQRA